MIIWGSREEKWGSFRGQFGDHFRVVDHFGVGIISGAAQSLNLPVKGSSQILPLETLSRV